MVQLDKTQAVQIRSTRVETPPCLVTMEVLKFCEALVANAFGSFSLKLEVV